MEPPRSLHLLDSRGLFRLHEISPTRHLRLQSVKLGASTAFTVLAPYLSIYSLTQSQVIRIDYISMQLGE